MRAISHLVSAMLIALAVAMPAAAQEIDPRAAVRAGQARPLGQILGAVQQRCPGKFLDARLQRGQGGLVYQIKLLRRGGRVANLAVDARSGAIIGGRC